VCRQARCWWPLEFGRSPRPVARGVTPVRCCRVTPPGICCAPSPPMRCIGRMPVVGPPPRRATRLRQCRSPSSSWPCARRSAPTCYRWSAPRVSCAMRRGRQRRGAPGRWRKNRGRLVRPRRTAVAAFFLPRPARPGAGVCRHHLVRPLSSDRGEPRQANEPETSALRRAQGQAGDELLLEQEEDDQCRQSDEHRAGSDQVVVGEELTAQIVQ